LLLLKANLFVLTISAKKILINWTAVLQKPPFAYFGLSGRSFRLHPAKRTGVVRPT
jgi:hypothetical protein